MKKFLLFFLLVLPVFGQQEAVNAVSTFAQLRLFKPTDINKSVLVRGGTAENDGKGGPFYWDASGTGVETDDLIISSRTTTGRWKRIGQSSSADLVGKVDVANGTHSVIATGSTASRTVQDRFAVYLDPVDFGAIPNGESTLGIQRALNQAALLFAGTNQSVAIKFNQPGDYFITNTVSVVYPSRVAMVGIGVATGSDGPVRIRTTTMTSGYMIDVSNGSVNVFSMSGIVLYGSGLGTLGGVKIGAAGTTMYDSEIAHCWFTGLPGGTGIELLRAMNYRVIGGGVENSAIGVHINNTDVPGIDYVNSTGLNHVTSVTFYGCAQAIRDEFSYATRIADSHFNLCGAAANGSGAITLIRGNTTESRNHTVIGNTFDRSVRHDIYIESSGDEGTHTGFNDISIVGNHSDFAGGSFLRVNGADQVSIGVNTIKDCSSAAVTYPAIHLFGDVDGASVFGNSVWISGAYGPTYGLYAETNVTGLSLGHNRWIGRTDDLRLDCPTEPNGDIQGTAIAIKQGENLGSVQLPMLLPFGLHGLTNQVLGGVGDLRYRGEAWVTNTVYSAGQYILNDSGKQYICITNGTSATSGSGPTGTGSNITDGTAHWNYDSTPNGRQYLFGYDNNLDAGWISAGHRGVGYNPIIFNAGYMTLAADGSLTNAGGYHGLSLNLSGLTASRALVSDGSKNVTFAATTAAELDFLSGVTSPIQPQIAAKVSTNNGAYYFTSDGASTMRSVKERAGERPSGKDFGTDTTGGSDAASALQSGINAVTNIGRLMTSAGTNRLDSTLTTPRRFTLEGASAENGSDINGHRTLLSIQHTNDAITLNTNSTGTHSAGVFRNLFIQRQAGYGGTNRLLRLNDTTGSLVEGMYFDDEGTNGTGGTLLTLGPNSYFSEIGRTKFYSDRTNAIGLEVIYPSTVNLLQGNMFSLAHGVGVRVDSPDLVSIQNNYEFGSVGLKLGLNAGNAFGPYGSVSLGDHYEQNSVAGVDLTELSAPVDFTFISPQFAGNGVNFRVATNRVLQGLTILGGSGLDAAYGNANAELAAQLRNMRVYAESYDSGVQTYFEPVTSAASSYSVFNWWKHSTNTGLREFDLWRNGSSTPLLKVNSDGEFRFKPLSANPTFELNNQFILTNGMVGIGTIAPVRPIEVSGSSNTIVRLSSTINTDQWSNGAPIVRVEAYTGDPGGNGAGVGGFLEWFNDEGTTAPFFGFRIGVNGTARDSQTIVATWDRDGNLGLGTTNPATKLDVNGTVTAVGVNVTGVTASKIAVFNSGKNLVSGTIAESEILTEAEAAAAYSPLGHTHAATDIGPGTVDNTEFGYLDGVTGGIQTNIDNRLPKVGIVCMAFAASDETTALTTGNAKITLRAPFAFTITGIRASLSTESSSGLVTVDINESGSTILSTKVTIDANERTSVTAATPAVVSDSSIADDAEITVDIDGAGTGAKGLKITIYGTP